MNFAGSMTRSTNDLKHRCTEHSKLRGPSKWLIGSCKIFIMETFHIEIRMHDRIVTCTRDEPYNTVPEQQRAMRMFNLFAAQFPVRQGFLVRLIAQGVPVRTGVF